MKILAKNAMSAAVLLLGCSNGFTPRAQAQGGMPLWTNRYHGPGYGNDAATAIAVDASGNAFVTGYSWGDSPIGFDYATIAYSGDGTALWTNRYTAPLDYTGPPDTGNDRPTGIAVDATGKVFVAGYSWNGTNYDSATVAYSNSGVPLWTNRSKGPGKGLAVDNNNHVFVTGTSPGDNGRPTHSTVAYSSGGVRLWTNYYGLYVDDSAAAIAVDRTGNIFVLGDSYGGPSGGDYATVAYSSAGMALWTNRYTGPGGTAYPDRPVAIAVDSHGHVVVTGNSTGMNDYSEYATVAYSDAGVPLWTNHYNEFGTGTDQAKAMAVDRSGNVFVTGVHMGSNAATVAYSSNGTPLWTNLFNGQGEFSVATAITVDSGGNVLVAGYAASTNRSPFNNAPFPDLVTVAYSGAGVPLWTNLYSSPANNGDYGSAVAVDSSGNVLVTGYSIRADGIYDIVTIKYSSSLPPIHLAIAPDGSGGYYIRFNGVPGSSYRLQRAAQLSGPWTTSGPQTAPDSGAVEFHDLFPPLGHAFYRTLQP